MFVSAMNERSSEIFLIELPRPKSLDVLTQFNNDYNHLCDFLDIKKNRLVILNPNKAKKPPRAKSNIPRSHIDFENGSSL
jgi:hypothetical protein